MREASKRVLGMRHFDVQLVGGMVLHYGKIAEMRTGEGKTLVSTLPAYLNALAGRGVHVVTVNDYLVLCLPAIPGGSAPPARYRQNRPAAQDRDRIGAQIRHSAASGHVRR